MISVKVIADSVCGYTGTRITTMELVYPRFIHSEFMTHRVFSRNASSSRAIPVKKMIEMVRNDPAMPIHWGKNQPGMQANEQLGGIQLEQAKELWMCAAHAAASIAEDMNTLGLHKQVANRILEPFQHIHVIVTSTDWLNFFNLRAHPDAQPEIQALAVEMWNAMDTSTPQELFESECHLPYVTDEEKKNLDIEDAKMVSAARCCRVSYLKTDGNKPSLEDDLKLFARLAGSVPIHASPLEHQARPDATGAAAGLYGNFADWVQFRKEIELEG